MHWAGVIIVPAGQQSLVFLALLAGWLSVPPGLAVSALIGAGRAGCAATLTAASFLPPMSLLLVSPTGSPPADLLLGQILFGAVVAAVIVLRRSRAVNRLDLRRLLHFAPAGIAIGLLSPIAMILARARISDSLSWEHVAMVQAVWRANEWTTAVVAGMLYVHYLPKLGAATLTLPTPGASGSLGAARAIIIDAVAPSVDGLLAIKGVIEVVEPESDEEDGVSIASALATPVINFAGMKAIMTDEGLTKLITTASPGQKVRFGVILAKPLGKLVKNCPASLKRKVFAQSFTFTGVLSGKVPPLKFPPFKGIAQECKYNLFTVGFGLGTGVRSGPFKVKVTNTLTGFRATNNSATGAFAISGKR